MANAFILAKWRMHRLLKKNARPFIARIGKNGSITALYSKEDLAG
jgi:hypothetical protein